MKHNRPLEISLMDQTSLVRSGMCVCVCVLAVGTWADLDGFRLFFSPPGWFFHADPLQLQCDRLSVFSTLVFCMVNLHYQDNSYYPTTLAFSLLCPLSIFVTLSCTDLPLVQLSSIFSFILQPVFSQQLKSFVPTEEKDRSIPSPPTSTLDCRASPLNSAWGDYTSFPLTCPHPLPRYLLFPTILFADILITAHSDLLCLARLILSDRYFFSPLVCSPPTSLSFSHGPAFLCMFGLSYIPQGEQAN